MIKCNEGDQIRFINQDAIAEGIGTIVAVYEKPIHCYDVHVDKILRMSGMRAIDYNVLHDCLRYDERSYYRVRWNNVVEVIEPACQKEVSAEDLELILNG